MRSKRNNSKKHLRKSKKTFRSRRHRGGSRKINKKNSNIKLYNRGGALPEPNYMPQHILFNYNACGDIIIETKDGKETKTVKNFNIIKNSNPSTEQHYQAIDEKIRLTDPGDQDIDKYFLNFKKRKDGVKSIKFKKIKKGLCKGDKERDFSFYKLTSSDNISLYALVYSDNEILVKNTESKNSIHELLDLINNGGFPDVKENVRGAILLQYIKFITIEPISGNRITMYINYFDTEKDKIREMKLSLTDKISVDDFYNFVRDLCIMVSYAKNICKNNYEQGYHWNNGIYRNEFLENEIKISNPDLCSTELSKNTTPSNNRSNNRSNNNNSHFKPKSIEDIKSMERQTIEMTYETGMVKGTTGVYQKFTPYDIMYGYNVTLYDNTYYPSLFELETTLQQRSKYQEIIQSAIENIDAQLSIPEMLTVMNSLNISMGKLKAQDLKSNQGKKTSAFTTANFETRNFFVFKCSDTECTGNQCSTEEQINVKYYLIYSDGTMTNEAFVESIKNFKYTNQGSVIEEKLCKYPRNLESIINDKKHNQIYSKKINGEFLKSLKGCLDLSSVKLVDTLQSGLVNLVYYDGEKIVKLMLKYKSTPDHVNFMSHLIKLIADIKNSIIEERKLALTFLLKNELDMNYQYHNTLSSTASSECE